MGKSVRKVSARELSDARANSAPAVSSSKKTVHQSIKDGTTYIEKLYDNPKNPIGNFFKGGENGSNPLGYKEHSYENLVGEDCIVVLFDDYLLLFNDNTRYIVEEPNPSEKAVALSEYARKTGTTVQEMFAKKINELFMQNFPESYAEKKTKFDQNNIDAEKRNLPADVQSFFGPAIEQQRTEAEYPKIVSAYGTADFDAILNKFYNR